MSTVKKGYTVGQLSSWLPLCAFPRLRRRVTVDAIDTCADALTDDSVRGLHRNGSGDDTPRLATIGVSTERDGRSPLACMSCSIEEKVSRENRAITDTCVRGHVYCVQMQKVHV